LLLLEHKPALTLGLSGKLENLLVSKDQLVQKNISLHFIDRGGILPITARDSLWPIRFWISGKKSTGWWCHAPKGGVWRVNKKGYTASPSILSKLPVLLSGGEAER